MSGKIRWCAFCQHTPPEGDATSLQQLEPLLPPDYEHSVCSLEADESGGLKVSLKLKAQEEEEVKKWLQDFQNTSKSTWRVAKTYHGSTRRNKYRVDLRCQHGGYGLYKATKKNLFCPAMLYLTLKQDIVKDKAKRRSTDPHLHNQLNFYILLRHTHNHQLMAPESLRHRDVSKETIEKLEALFHHGHSPSSALKALKNQLRAQTGEAFEAAILDHALCPDLAFCYRRFYKMFPERKGKRRGRKKGTKGAAKRDTVFIDQNGASTDETFEALQALQQTPVQVCVPEGSVYTVVQLSDTELRLRSMFQELLDKLRTEAEIEEPLRAMLCSYETMSSDGEKLAFALKTFGRMKRGNTKRSAPKPSKRAKLSEPAPSRETTTWVTPIQGNYISYTVTPTTPSCTTFKITQ